MAAIVGYSHLSLSITDLQSSLRHPERLVGLHYFNPVHINRLVEVIRGRQTAESGAQAFALLLAAPEFQRR